MSFWRVLMYSGLLALTACGEVEIRPEPPATPPPPPAASAPPEKPARLSQPLKHALGRSFAPQPTRPLNVRSQCSTKDAIGTRTQLKLLVKDAEVRSFAAQVAIPKQGICRFDLKDFEQTARLPQAVLKARDGSDCSVRFWEEGARVTVAFNSCPKACQGDAFSYLWPILVESRTGRCA